MTNLFHAAQKAGITVEYCRIPLNASLSVQDEGGDFVLMDYSLLKDETNERVHLAHEIGHCIKGAFYNAYAAHDVRQKHENRADKWAIRQLIPKSAFFRALGNGYTEICQLAEYFNVTEEFMRKALCYYVYGNLAVELYF